MQSKVGDSLRRLMWAVGGIVLIFGAGRKAINGTKIVGTFKGMRQEFDRFQNPYAYWGFLISLLILGVFFLLIAFRRSPKELEGAKSGEASS